MKVWITTHGDPYMGNKENTGAWATEDLAKQASDLDDAYGSDYEEWEVAEDLPADGAGAAQERTPEAKAGVMRESDVLGVIE